MISGRKHNVTTLVVALTLCLTSTSAWAGSGSTFTRLMALLAARTHGEVTFHARTYARGLSHPLVSRGVLRYRAPDHLEQHTLEPRPSEMILDGERLTVHRDGHTRHLDLHAYPQIAVYVSALRATLAGNGAALKRLFTIDLAGTLAHWRLTLTPIAPNGHVRRIRLVGTRANIHIIELFASHGARTVMRIGPAPSS